MRFFFGRIYMDKRIILKTFLTISVIVSVPTTGTITKGAIIYVDDDAVGVNDGSSWENAYVYLQEALADAKTAEKPVEIRVAQGVYRPNAGLMTAPVPNWWRATTFHLTNSVALKGGYAGIGEEDPNAHDLRLYETILSGDLNGDDIEVVNPEDLLDEPTRADNSYRVVTGIGVDETAILNGFIITGGQADGPEFTNWPEYENLQSGGGIYNYSGSPTIINCTFKSNQALDYGGGMCNYESNPTLTNCIFRNNHSKRSGAGMFNHQSSPSLKNCTFSENWAERGGGGGMHNRFNSNSILINCIFTANSGVAGGGMDNAVSSPTITNCTFSRNYSTFRGGGLYSNGEGYPILTNCIITGNTTGPTEHPYGEGGGIYNSRGSNITLTNCRITGNKVGQIYGIGGGICNNNYNESSSVLLMNCTMADNFASDGDAIACDSKDQNFPSKIEIINCILWNGGDEIWNNDNSTITITFSNVQGLIKGRSGKPIGGINKDPCFVRQGYWDVDGLWIDGDYHLESQAGRWDPNSESWVQDDVTSPCIDTGDPNSPIGHEPFPNGGIINMGAYGGTSEASMSSNNYSELLESAVRMAGIVHGDRFQIVRFDVTETPWPNFWPIKDLDGPQAVPYLINVLENGPAWTDENLLKARGGIYPHIARCFAALCLGVIGDSRAFESLIKVLQYGDYLEDRFEITYERKDQYHISDYAALALGYLGDPNAVDPLIDVLEKGEREWTIYGFTILRDVKAIKPIIEYLSINNKFNRRFHSCLEHISRAFLPIKYSSNTRKYTIIDFPELGEFEGNNVYQALWEHWLVIGDEFAREQFEEYYPKWILLIQERPDDQFSQDRAIFRMVRGGVPALPYIMDQIDKGDESLLPAVEFIRKGGPIAGCSLRAPAENRDEILLWWTENKQKWLIFDIQEPNNSDI